MIRYEIFFKGRVQGVGFRYTARDFAEEFGLVGWVKNLPDGSVQIVAEGGESEVDDLINKLESYFAVKNKSVVRSAARGDLASFDIVY